MHDSEPSGSTPKDPVCGMEVNPESPFRTTYEGREYLFCSRHCLAKFKEDPGQYFESGQSEAPAASSPETAGSAAGAYFTCPMHPDVKETVAGKCPHCGMPLESVPAEEPQAPSGKALKAPPGSELFDPVCGMTVGSDTAYRISHQGQEYGFCSEHCLNKFREQPEMYLQAAAGEPGGQSAGETAGPVPPDTPVPNAAWP